MRICTLLAAVAFLMGPTVAAAGDKDEIKLKDGKHTRAVNLTTAAGKYRDKPATVFSIRLEKDKTYQFDLTAGAEGDPFLVLQDGKGNKDLASDDDGGDNLNSRLVFKCTESGVYRIVCTVFDAEDTALFNLMIEEKK